MTIRNRLIKAQIVTMVGAALLAPALGDAATLGRMTVQSGRNEPLRAEIQVMQIDPREAASLSARIGSRVAHEQARIPYPEEAAKIEATIARKPDGAYVVQLRSREVITEPMLDILVELKSPVSEVGRPYLIDTSIEGRAGSGTESVRGDSAARSESLLRTEAQVRGDPMPQRLGAPATAPAAAAPPAFAPATAPAAGSSVTTPPAAPAAESPSSVAVAKGDTLAAIAARAKADEVSLDRAMLAIFRANRQAFFGSIHQLKSDQTLQIPSRETMLAEPDEFIARELRRHSEIFRNYKAQVAGSVPLASNQPAPAARDAAAAGTEKFDRLVLSKGAGSLSNEEQRAAAEVALREANVRISELQRNISDLKRLAALKDRQIAEVSAQLKTLAVDRPAGGSASGASLPGPAVLPSSLQPGVAAATSATSANASGGAEPSGATLSEAAKGELKSSATPAAPGSGSTSESAVAPASPATASGATITPAPSSAAPVALKRADPPATLRTEDDTSLPSYWIYGGVALLVLLIGFMVRRSRQRKAAQDALDDDPHSLFGDSAELDSRIKEPADTISGKSNDEKKPQVVAVN